MYKRYEKGSTSALQCSNDNIIDEGRVPFNFMVWQFIHMGQICIAFHAFTEIIIIVIVPACPPLGSTSMANMCCILDDGVLYGGGCVRSNARLEGRREAEAEETCMVSTILHI